MWGRRPRRQGHFSSFARTTTVPIATRHNDSRMPVANVTQKAPGETLAESSTSNIGSSPAALSAVGGQHEMRLAGATTIDQ
ncbi:MAG: hypothetical protein QOI88_2630 [Gammaproteobacteria bacterium]|jgi:hypothetical protein|nr:hypothetical protein [Gammaproteobacteria bacterium]